MWAFLAGFFGAKVLRDGSTPDSVKQQRWDAKVATREARRDAQSREPGEPLVGQAAGRVILGLLGLTVVVLVVVALTQ